MTTITVRVLLKCYDKSSKDEDINPNNLRNHDKDSSQNFKLLKFSKYKTLYDMLYK